MKKYRLIKTYPIDIELGAIAYWGSHGLSGECYQVKTKKRVFRFNKETIENNPEYWEEVVEKDYEILSFWCKQFNYKLELDKDSGKYINDFKRLDYEYLLGATMHYQIHSVKRLSDGEVFTVGDKIDSIAGNNVIKKFCIGTDKLQKHMMFYNKCYSISLLSKFKKPLFTTEDGVDIFEDDEFYSISKINFTWKSHGNINYKFKAGTKKPNSLYNVAYFSTKEAAEKYILMNKPCLSINDILKIDSFSSQSKLNKIFKLVKSKL